jgi:tetratricopeptide (TPR) repeat protein
LYYTVLFLDLAPRRRYYRLFTLLFEPGGLTGSQTLTEKVLGKEHPDTLMATHNLAISYGGLGHAQDEDHPSLARMLNNLGRKLEDQYDRTGKIEDLEQAIRVSRQAVDITPGDHPDLAVLLNDLGNQLGSRYERTGKIEDLEEAIRMIQQAVDVTPKDHPNLARWLNNLGNQLERLYERTGKVEDLEEAVRITRQAVDMTPRDHPYLASTLNNLGNKLGRRYECTGKMEDLEEAIGVARQTIDLTPRDHPNLAPMLKSLGNKLGRRYERTGKVDDLEEAIRVIRQAVDLTPEDHPDLAGGLNSLGNKLELRCEHTGKMDDLEEAIRVTRQAVSLTPENHSSFAWRLDSLGNKFESLYDRIGKMEDLEEAIQLARQALDITPEGHPDLARMLNNLGGKLSRRYGRTRIMENLEEAIRLTHQAVDIMTEGQPDLARVLNNLGGLLVRRYERTGKVEDLEEAIGVTRQAVNITPKGHPDLAGRLNNLGAELESRYECTGKMEDLEEAIRVAHQAVDVTSEDHPNLAGWLNNLGGQLVCRYDRTGKVEDLEEAIGVACQAVDLTPEDHPDLARMLYNLSRKLLFPNSPSKHDVLEVLLRAWNCYNAIPFVRIRASTLAIQLLQDRGDYAGAYKLCTEALELLPHVHNRFLSHQDQQHVVSLFSGLATNACALALQLGELPEKALEILERGRGAILGLLIDDRSDTSVLKAAYPNLCAIYESLRLEVNAPIDSIADQRLREMTVKRRIEAIEELDKCVRDIRKLPEFGQFQKGLTTEQMRNCSTQGYIIAVNVAELRSDAIVVSINGFKSIPLPRLDAFRAKYWIDQDLTAASSSDRGAKNKAYLQFLSWVWRGCVKLILDELYYHVQPSIDCLPRIWWIGTGLASSFPFHAAGDISAGPTESAYCRVISSYTPSIKALAYARERKSTTTSCREPPKLLIVTMANTPGACDLPGTRIEKSEIIAAVGTSASVETLDQPDVESVMHHIRQCDIVHFACHGVSDPIDPSKSGLLLQTARTATAEPRLDILSVRRVSQAHLSQAEIAYLSACSTAENRAAQLVDEVLHVVSGFQIAGFRHVIGCLWPSSDSVCVEVAKSFYSKLSRSGNIGHDDKDIASALHKVLVEIKDSDEYRKRPLHWAQYVHFGV